VSDEQQLLRWREGDIERSALWQSESGGKPPVKVVLADDTTRADPAFHMAAEGTALLYRGDYHNARQLLSALTRRVESRRKLLPGEPLKAFHAHRQAQSATHQILSKVLVEFDGEYRLPLKRAPDVREACTEAWGAPRGAGVVSLRELLGVIGAHEWRSKGVEVPALDGRVHPHYGVFSPVRGEYIDLVAKAPLPAECKRAFDLGTGTGVLALLLAKRGVAEVVATDSDPRAIACARENVQRFGLSERIVVEERDLFPEGRANLVVFNPPWLPGKPRTPVERAIYDPDGKTVQRFLSGLGEHLTEAGEGWLIISDLAEHIGLRSKGWLDEALKTSGLVSVGSLETAPSHPKANDTEDPLFAFRSQEITSLHRLKRS
jgi:methylase of polypeptide subunit release factors